jgi:DNA-binding response OmpR family regulator
MPKRILVGTHDLPLLAIRSSLVLKAGYQVVTAVEADSAIELLGKADYDLVVVGCNSAGLRKQVDQQIREKYPTLPILKIVDLTDHGISYGPE